MTDERQADKQAYPAEKARQGQIILRTSARRAIFFGGLIGFVLLALIFRFAFPG
jgi:hypothetical protein